MKTFNLKYICLYQLPRFIGIMSRQSRFYCIRNQLTIWSAERAKDAEELINLAISWEERVLSELKNC